MNLAQALNWLHWRISKCQKIHVTKKDIKAFNVIVEELNRYNSVLSLEHEMTFKLYVNEYTNYILKYQSLPNNPIPQKEFHRFLGKEIEWHIMRMSERLRDQSLFNFSENLNNQSFKMMSSEKVNMQLETLKSIHDYNDIEYLTTNMTTQFAEALKKFK